jgi:hypothetical protein
MTGAPNPDIPGGISVFFFIAAVSIIEIPSGRARHITPKKVERREALDQDGDHRVNVAPDAFEGDLQTGTPASRTAPPVHTAPLVSLDEHPQSFKLIGVPFCDKGKTRFDFRVPFSCNLGSHSINLQ